MKSERELLRENLERFRTKSPHRTVDPAKRSPKFKKLTEEKYYPELNSGVAESIFSHMKSVVDNYQSWLKSHKHETLRKALEWLRDDLLSEKNLQTLFNGPAHEDLSEGENTSDVCQLAREWCKERSIEILPVSWLERRMEFPEHYKDEYPDETESDWRDRMWTSAVENLEAISLQEIEAILRSKKEDTYNLENMLDDVRNTVVDDPNLRPEDFHY